MTPRSCRPLAASSRVFAPGIAVALVALATPTMAGPSRESSGGALSRTTSEVHERTSSSHSSDSSDSDDSSDSYDSSDSDDSDSDDSEIGFYTSGGGCYDCARFHSPGAYTPLFPEVHVAVNLGLQSVHDSDGAAMASVRIKGTRFGLALTGTRYFEEGQALDGTTTIYMNLWAATAEARLIDVGKTALWLSGGAGGVTSNQFDPLTGVTFGAKITHDFNPNLGFYGGVRYFILPDGLGAGEYTGGITVAFLNLGYRSFAFDDAGEALHGPEFGIAFGF